MRAKPAAVVWAAFLLSVILTWIVYFGAWMAGSYYLILSILGIISVLAGLWVLIANRFAWRSVILVVLGLVIGQWWFIELMAVQIIWTLKGFAP